MLRRCVSNSVRRYATSRTVPSGFSASAISGERYQDVAQDHGIPHVLLSQPSTEVTPLANGFRVASEETEHNSPTATVGVWINSGSRYDPYVNAASPHSNKSGVAHFTEHLLFKGTAKRSRVDLEREFENMGGNLNAYTSREQTAFFATVFKEDVGKAVEIIADILQNSKIEEKAVEEERSVIAQEMHEVESQVDEFIFDRLHETAFQTDALGGTILGTSENVSKKITADDLKKYVLDNYVGPRMVLAGAGGIAHRDLVDVARSCFGNLSPTDKVRMPQSRFVGSEVKILNEEMPRCHTAIAVEGPSWNSPDVVPCMLIQTLLGSWDEHAPQGKHSSSQLAMQLSRRNCATSMSSFLSHYNDTGLMGVYATCDPNSLGHDTLVTLMYEICHEFCRMCFKLDDAELQRAKNQLKTSLLLALDGSANTADDIGRQVLVWGRRVSFAEAFARIDAVSVRDLQNVAMKYFYDQDVAVATVGDTNYFPDYNWVRNWMHWIRY